MTQVFLESYSQGAAHPGKIHLAPGKAFVVKYVLCGLVY